MKDRIQTETILNLFVKKKQFPALYPVKFQIPLLPLGGDTSVGTCYSELHKPLLLFAARQSSVSTNAAAAQGQGKTAT